MTVHPLLRVLVVAVALSIGTAPECARAAAKEGQAIFAAQKCIKCHTLGEEAGEAAGMGGVLDGVGSKRTPAWLKSYLQDPSKVIPASKMPQADLQPAEIDSLVAYLSSLK